jgi:lipoprotein-anchoring transpeptidase ErfK/SrfK
MRGEKPESSMRCNVSLAARAPATVFLAMTASVLILSQGSIAGTASAAETTAEASASAPTPAEAPPKAPVSAASAAVEGGAAKTDKAGQTETKVAARSDDTAKPKPAAPTLTAHIDLSSQTMTVREGGHVIHTWKVSTGRSGYLTPPGSFRPKWVSRMHYSRKYDLSPMPHSVFFNGGIAVHGTYATGMLGRPASHGCVRLARGNAATFYRLVGRHGLARTRIVVHGRTPASRSNRIARDEGRSRRGSRGGYSVEGPRWVSGSGYVYPGDSYGYRRGSVWGW